MDERLLKQISQVVIWMEKAYISMSILEISDAGLPMHGISLDFEFDFFILPKQVMGT